MNAKEGIRRLGIVTGILGGCVGLLAAYAYLTETLAQRHEHEEFKRISESPTVQKEIESIYSLFDPKRHPDWFKPLAPPPPKGHLYDYFGNPLDVLPNQERASSRYNEAVDALSESKGWAVNSNGIDKIYMGRLPNRAVTKIDKADGTTIREIEAPPVKDYLFPLVLPILGFLLPWGSFKTIAWIVSGFAKS